MPKHLFDLEQAVAVFKQMRAKTVPEQIQTFGFAQLSKLK